MKSSISSNSGVWHLQSPLYLVAFLWIWQNHSVLPRNRVWVKQGQGFMPLHHRLLWYKQWLKEGGLEMEEMVSNKSTSVPAWTNLSFCGIEIKRKLTFVLFQWKKQQHMQLHLYFGHNAVQRVDPIVTLENELIAFYHCSKDTLLKLSLCHKTMIAYLRITSGSQHPSNCHRVVWAGRDL